MQRELSSISQFNIHSVEKQKLNLMRFFIDINTYLAELQQRFFEDFGGGPLILDP